jgi:hypothetical protein
MVKLRDLEITRLTRELVQESVSYEELQQAGEEKDVTILELSRRSRQRAPPSRWRRSRSKVSCSSRFSLVG